MNQSGKFALFISLIGILLITGLSACNTTQINANEIANETPTPINTDETGGTSTPISSEGNSSNSITVPAIKAEIQPTFNATLHVEQRVEPHLLAILGSYKPSIANEAVFAFAADGKSFVMQDGAQLSVWRVSPLKEIRTIPVKTEGVIQKIALSEDNHYAAAILLSPDDENALLLVWKIMSGETVISQELGRLQENAAGLNQQADVWAPYELAFIPGTNTLACKIGRDVQTINVEGDAKPAQLTLREDMTAQKITFTRDGRFLYVLLFALSYDNQPIYQIQIWDTSTLKLRESVSLEDLYTKSEVDLQASYVLIRNAEEMSLQKMSMENEELEGLPYRLGSTRITADGLYLIFQHIPDSATNRQYDIEFWSAYNWRKLYVLDNDGEGVNIDYPMDLSSPNEIIFNLDHSIMAICNNGKAYLYDISGIFPLK